MKKTSSLVFVFLLSFSGLAFSQGIPTYDNANVMLQQQNFIKQLAEMAEQLKVAQDQLNSFKNEAMNMQRRLEGYTGFVDGFAKKDLINSLNDLINKIDTESVNSFLERNNLSEITDERMKENVKREATTYSIYEGLITQLKDVNKDISNLEKKFQQAQTPQEREELANAISIQKMKLDNLNKTAEYELKKIEIDNKAKDDAEYYEYINSFFVTD